MRHFKNYTEMIDFIKENDYTDMYKFCDDYLKFCSIEWGGLKNKLDDYIKRSRGTYPYFEFYCTFFHTQKLIARNYDEKIFNDKSIRKSMIIKNGSNFEDGFSGVIAKASPYSSWIHIQVVDGEKGTLFVKAYFDGTPSLNVLMADTLFPFLQNDGKNSIPSLLGIFKDRAI